MNLVPEIFNPGYPQEKSQEKSRKVKHSTSQWLQDLHTLLNATEGKIFGENLPLEEVFSQAHDLLKEVREQDGCVWWAGNGGSASLCSHFAQDLVNKKRIRSLPFSDASLLTCQANDFGYENAYARLIDMYARPGDLVIAISSSGESKNILNAMEVARVHALPSISLSGFNAGNSLNMYRNPVCFYTPSDSYGLVETAHGALLHAIIDTL